MSKRVTGSTISYFWLVLLRINDAEHDTAFVSHASHILPRSICKTRLWNILILLRESVGAKERPTLDIISMDTQGMQLDTDDIVDMIY